MNGRIGYLLRSHAPPRRGGDRRREGLARQVGACALRLRSPVVSPSQHLTGTLESTPRPRPLAPCRGGECYATYVNVWGRACACHAVMGPGVRAPAAAHAAGRGPGRDLRPTTRNREKRLSHEPARRRRRRGGVIGTGRHYRYPGRSAPSHRAAHVLLDCSPTIDFGGTLDAERDRSCDLSKYPLRLSPRRYIENRIYRSGDRARTIQYVVLLVSLFHLLFYADFSLDCSRDLAASYALS